MKQSWAPCKGIETTRLGRRVRELQEETWEEDQTEEGQTKIDLTQTEQAPDDAPIVVLRITQ